MSSYASNIPLGNSNLCLFNSGTTSPQEKDSPLCDRKINQDSYQRDNLTQHQKITNVSLIALQRQQSCVSLQTRSLSRIEVSEVKEDDRTLSEERKQLAFDKLTEHQKTLVEHVNINQCSLAKLNSSKEDIKKIAPFLIYVNLTGLENNWRQEELSELIEKLSSAKTLVIRFSKIKMLSLKNSPLLESLDCFCCSLLQNLDVSHNRALNKLNCSDCAVLETPDFSNNPALKVINCFCCEEFRMLDFSKNLALEEVNCFDCIKVKVINLTNNSALKKISCGSCKNLLELDLSNKPKLREVKCSDCIQVRSLNFSDNSELAIVNCNGCVAVEELNFSRNLELEELDCKDCTLLTVLKFSNNPSLIRINCQGCKALRMFPEIPLRTIVQSDLDSSIIEIPIEKVSIHTENGVEIWLEGILDDLKVWLDKKFFHFPRIRIKSGDRNAFQLVRAYLINTLLGKVLNYQEFMVDGANKVEYWRPHNPDLWRVVGWLIGIALRDGHLIGYHSNLFKKLLPAIRASILAHDSLSSTELEPYISDKTDVKKEVITDLAKIAKLLVEGMKIVPPPFHLNLEPDQLQGQVSRELLMSRIKYGREVVGVQERDGKFPREKTPGDPPGSLTPGLIRKWIEEKASIQSLEQFIKAVTGQDALSLDGPEILLCYIPKENFKSSVAREIFAPSPEDPPLNELKILPVADPSARRLFLTDYEYKGNFEKTLEEFSKLMEAFLSQVNPGFAKIY